MGVVLKPKPDFQVVEMVQLANFLKNESGMETVEYALMAAIITLGLLSVISALSDVIFDRFQVLCSATES